MAGSAIVERTELTPPSLTLESNRALRFGLGLAAVLVVITALGPWLMPHDAFDINLDRRLEAPSLEFPFGTDRLGRCVLSRTLLGARPSLGLALLASFGASAAALSLSTLAVFGGRFGDRLVTRAIDVFISFPSLVLALAIVGVMGPSAMAVVTAIVWAWWPSETRVVRSLLHTARHRDFVDAAFLGGVHPVRLVTRHILPQVGPALAVRASLEMASVILALSTLSFLGLGLQPPHPEWGNMLNEARPFVMSSPHLLFGPGVALILSVLSLNLIAEGLRSRVDSRQAQEW